MPPNRAKQHAHPSLLSWLLFSGPLFFVICRLLLGLLGVPVMAQSTTAPASAVPADWGGSSQEQQAPLQPNGKHDPSPKVRFGNHYNYWIYDTPTNTFDLTRGGSQGAITLPTSSKGDSKIVIAPERSALVIIDMQNFFLHPSLAPRSTLGRLAVPPTLRTISAFRQRGMRIAWVNWGITAYDMNYTLSPSFLYNFSGNKKAEGTSFLSDMGSFDDPDAEGKGRKGKVEAGRKLGRGEWNSLPYGPLYESFLVGKKGGTDFHFDKNTPSGLSGGMTPLEQWLRDEGITTLFFGGVNTDQCVWGTMLDASQKGYDAIMVRDLCATTSPEFATQMVVYNMDRRGWVMDSSMLLPALA